MSTPTLYDRLKPEFIQSLDGLDEYPTTRDYLKKNLKKHYFITELPFGVVIDLVQYLTDKPGDIDVVWKLFNEYRGEDSSLQSDHNAQTTNT